MSAGGFVLTNFQIEIPEYFEIGKEIETFSSQEELLDKITYYLEHEEERNRLRLMVMNGPRVEYSLDTRIGQMLNMI